MKTFSATPADINKKWYVVDAQDLVLGRMSTEIAKILRGKHKASFTPHMDCGDNVIVINAEKVHLTGKKVQDKVYYRHTGYPGGIRSIKAGKVIEGEHPERVITGSIKGMLGKTPMGRQQLRNLYVYAGETHPHEAQKPEKLDLGAQNNKNKRVRDEQAA